MIVVSRSLLLSFIISFAVSCSFNRSDKKDIAVIHETLPVPIDLPTYYFPIDQLTRMDLIKVLWNSLSIAGIQKCFLPCMSQCYITIWEKRNYSFYLAKNI